jgi:hypothetical protein
MRGWVVGASRVAEGLKAPLTRPRLLDLFRPWQTSTEDDASDCTEPAAPKDPEQEKEGQKINRPVGMGGSYLRDFRDFYPASDKTACDDADQPAPTTASVVAGRLLISPPGPVRLVGHRIAAI